LRAAGIAVEVGLGAEEACRDHAGHLRRMRNGRPHVLLKLAVSADGKVGGVGRRTLVITGEAVRERVHLMRAQSDAVLVGIGTVLSDDPMLTCRLPGMAAYSPLRIVLDSALRVPLRSRLVETANETPVVVMAANEASQSVETALRQKGVDVVRSTGAGGNLDLDAALKRIAARGVTRLMVEGGPTLAASLFAADLVDELHVFTSSKIVGTDGIDAFNGPAAAALGSKLKEVRSDPVGADQHQAYERR
jgi:diaminohydroxyphosphoribosylaminopyrimidine deaminase/5-amino-6-(5-phosphoribosylamino)uracil reductase